MTRARVHVFIADGRLPVVKIGNQFIIDRKDLAKLEIRKTGRPPNPKAASKPKGK